MIHKVHYSLFALVGVMLAMSIGCGDGAPYRVVPLEGTITYKGEPVEGIFLQFSVDDYRPSTAAALSGGRFQAVHSQAVDGVPVGTVTLRFVWQNEIPPQAGSVHAELLSKYGIDTEGYVFELTRGDKNFRIDLE